MKFITCLSKTGNYVFLMLKRDGQAHRIFVKNFKLFFFYISAFGFTGSVNQINQNITPHIDYDLLLRQSPVGIPG